MSRVMVAGLCLGVTREPRKWEDREWVETTAHVLSGIESTQVRLHADFPESRVPERGEVVVFDCGVHSFSTRRGIQTTIEATGRLTSVEEALPQSVYDVSVAA